MKYLPEMIYGSTDGLITTFAIVSSVAGSNMSNKVIIILGLANVLADGFSMGVSSFLSEKVKPNTNPLKSGLVTFISFILIGVIPVLPFILSKKQKVDGLFKTSYIITGLLLFLIGTVKGKDIKSKLINGSESFLLGACAGGLAYYVGLKLKNINK